LKQIDFIGLRFQLPTSLFELWASLCELLTDKTMGQDGQTRRSFKYKRLTIDDSCRSRFIEEYLIILEAEMFLKG
jgi:hypothetical protein